MTNKSSLQQNNFSIKPKLDLNYSELNPRPGSNTRSGLEYETRSYSRPSPVYPTSKLLAPNTLAPNLPCSMTYQNKSPTLPFYKNISTQNTSNQNTFNQNTFNQNTSNQNTSNQNASNQNASNQNASNQNASKQNTSNQNTSNQNTSNQNTFKQNTSKQKIYNQKIYNQNNASNKNNASKHSLYPGNIDNEISITGTDIQSKYGFKDLGKNENSNAPEGNPFNMMNISAPLAPPIPVDSEANADTLDYDEQNVYQGTHRNDATRVAAGTMNRLTMMTPYLSEELTSTENEVWWGEHEV